MKKIFTLFVAIVAAMSIIAQPQPQLPKVQVKQAQHGKEVVAKTPAQEQAIKALKYDLTKRVANPAMPAKYAKQEAQFPIKPAQKLTQGTIQLDGGEFVVGPEYEEATREWYIAVQSNGYTFRLCWFGNADTYCGSYTMDDISYDYSWGWFQSSDMFYEIYFTDVQMTVSEKKVGNCLTQIILDAFITDTNDNLYILHIVHDIFTPKSTIESEITNTQLTAADGKFILDGNNSNLDVLLEVNSASIEGIFNQSNFGENTNILYNGVKQNILKADLQIASGYLDNGALGYLTELSFINQDTILHTVSMPSAFPTPKDTIKVECHNLDVDDSFADYGMICVLGSSSEYDIFASYEGYYLEAGVYDDATVVISDMTTWEMITSIKARLTLVEDGASWKANIEVYASDYNWYSIDMDYEVPEPTDTVKITFESTAIASYLPNENNMLQLLNYGDDYEASVTVFGVEPGNDFTMDNIYMDYCGIYDKNIESSIAIADIKGKLLQYGDTTCITASLIGFNAIQYDVELWYAVPAPIDTVELEMPVEFINAMDYGYYTLAAYTPDSAWYISLSPMTDKVAGTFVNDGLFGKFGAEGGAYDFYGGNTFVYSQQEWMNYTVEKGSLVVEVAPDGAITAEAKIICTNSIYYHIKMTSEYNNHLDYDEPEIEVDRTYTTEDNVTIDDQTAENGYIYLALTAADNSDMAAFFFFVEEADPEIIIPEGIYPIDASEEYGTVMANPGVQGDGVWPSFYAQLFDGGLAVPLWLLVGGTVEVAKDDAGNPHLEVNAYNSYGVPVHIVYNGAGTDVENIKDPAASNCQKRMVNGQLIIIRNGETFNAVGARIE